MTKLNNKGQSLVLFVLIIPIILLIFVIVIDFGNAFVSKQELDNVNYLATYYALDHINDANIEYKLVNMLYANNDNISQISVSVNGNEVKIVTKSSVNGIFANNFEILEISSSYIGYLKNNKKIIERV